MSIKEILKDFIVITLLSLLILSANGKDAFSAQVGKDEAAAVADLWYEMELNSGHLKIDKAKRNERLNNVKDHKILYMTSGDDLLDSPPDDSKVLAYVIKYEPSGFVVVSGDDRLEPIMVFDAESEFRWDEPERNFLRFFLEKEIPARKQCTEAKVAKGEKVDVHPNWTKLRIKVKKHNIVEGVVFEGSPVEAPSAANAATAGTTYVLWQTPSWNQRTPYNATVIANNGNTAGIPTGCLPTVLAEKLRFHEWPPAGNGTHTYTDSSGAVRFTHTVNYGNQTYNWTNMPTTNITTANADIADLMYHAGVSIDADYEIGLTVAGAVDRFISALDDHFLYRGSQVIYSDHEEPAKLSILGGLPVPMSTYDHAVLADGYRDTEAPYFHINVGWGGTCNGWYNLTNVFCNGGAVIQSLPYSAPPDYVYVDGIDKGMLETGYFESPYEKLIDGYLAVPNDGHLWVKAGSYAGTGNAPITFNKPMTVRSYEGAATIGP